MKIFFQPQSYEYYHKVTCSKLAPQCVSPSICGRKRARAGRALYVAACLALPAEVETRGCFLMYLNCFCSHHTIVFPNTQNIGLFCLQSTWPGFESTTQTLVIGTASNCPPVSVATPVSEEKFSTGFSFVCIVVLL